MVVVVVVAVITVLVVAAETKCKITVDSCVVLFMSLCACS